MSRSWACGHEGEGVEQQLDALVGLEVAGVEDDRPGAEGQLAAQRGHGLRRRRRRGVHERRVLDLEDGHLRRAGPHAVGQAGADGHRGGGVPQRVALEGLGQPEQRARGSRSRSSGAGRGSTSPRPSRAGPEAAARRARSGAPPPRPRGRRRSGRSAGATRPRPGTARRAPAWRATGRPSRGPTGSRRLRRWPHALGIGAGSPCGKVSRSTWWPSAGSARVMASTASGVPRTSKNGCGARKRMRSGRLQMAYRSVGEEALGVDRGHAAAARRGDRLAVAVVGHVAGGEDARARWWRWCRRA